MTESDDNDQPILVPVDFSAHSEAALRWAAVAAERYDATLIVLHVVHDPESAPGYYNVAPDDGNLRQREEAAQEYLETFLERMRIHPEIRRVGEMRTRLVTGLPATRILEVAKEERARMIVMGSKGRTGLGHMLLGSKAERVVQLSPIPVTIVKAEIPWEHG